MNIISLIILASSAISLFLSGYSLKYKNAPGALVFSGLMAAAAIYSFGYAFEIQSSSLHQVECWLSIEYIGIPFLAPFWLVFALQFTGHQKWLTKQVKYAIAIFTLVTLIIRHTNPLHHLFIKNISILFIDNLSLAQMDKGVWYWIEIAFINFSQVIATVLFIEMAVRKSGYYRKQAITMLLGSSVMWIFFLFYITGNTPYQLDSSPLGISVFGLFMAWGMFHYRMLDLVPFALEHVFKSLKDIVLLVNTNGVLIDYNPAASRMLNRYSNNPLGKNLSEDFGEISSLLSPLLDLEKENGLINFEVEGKLKQFNTVISNVHDDKGNLLGFAIVLNDITVQKETEQKLLELNAAREKFFSILAHDLKTPFVTILPVAEMLKEEAYDIPREDLNTLSQSLYTASNNGYSLLLDLLEWGKLQTGKMQIISEPVYVYSAVCECIDHITELAKAKNISIHLEGNEDTLVNTDKYVFSTVLRNLLSNAVKFSYSGGEVLINISEPDHQVKIAVKDFGVGISEKSLGKLFKVDSFYSSVGTADEKGTGLGLLLAKEMLGKVNGSINVVSEEGRGSEFSFLLPKN